MRTQGTTINPIVFAIRHPVITLMLALALVSGGVLGLSNLGIDVFPPPIAQKVHVCLEYIGTGTKQVKGYVIGQYESIFHKPKAEEAQNEHHKITVTSPMTEDVNITWEPVCQIHSRKHIDVCALESGYLEPILLHEGQEVKTNEVLFEIIPVLYKAKADAELAERDLAKIELDLSSTLAKKQGVSPIEPKLYQAKLAKAQAKADLALAELEFTKVRARFDGIVDRLRAQEGSLVKEGDILTTLSDNKVMWVYFNVTEKQYLQYMADTDQNKQSPDIELKLADHSVFPHTGKIVAIESNFNNTTGNIAFRADFPNPERLLRHGQTGTVLINRVLKGAIVIPQRATFENLAKRYVFVVDKNDVVHQREIVIDHVLEDLFVIGSGLDVNDRIVLEGVREVREGDTVEYEFLEPELATSNLKNKAE
jgi:membrane fusion protein (multidrug efflux system)